MAFESRKASQHRYFYQSVWRNGRSIKVYHGRGALAVMEAQAMARDRQERRAVREQCRYWRTTYLELRAMDAEAKCQADAVAAVVSTEAPAGIVDNELRDLLDRCELDRCLPDELKSHLNHRPDHWAVIGSLAERNIGRVIRLIARENETLRENLGTMVVTLRAGLGAATASTLQRLLIDRVVVADILENYFENRLLVAEQSGQPTLIRVLQAIVAGCQRQSLAAIRRLDQVSRRRRCGPPARTKRSDGFGVATTDAVKASPGDSTSAG
jgi:hypothetical protein